ncbi:hypothetical protein [Tissierella sp.]|uniref:hypothetical protein n=1 Tax=Tissierella sp. TaxID=41274 RepID=UPI003024148D
MEYNKTSIELFMYDIIAIIDKGHKESVDEVEKQIDNNNISQYILKKYNNLTMIDLESSDTNKLTSQRIDDINRAYEYNLSYIMGNESRKFGITKEDNGLLLLVAVGIMILGS